MIPNIVHYVYINERPWKLHHYLSVKSALVKAKVDKVHIWLDEEPIGEWWDKTKPLVVVHKVVPPTEIFGKPITQPAHKSDVIRLQILIEEGGIYADTDVIFIKPFKDLLDNQFVMGQQGVGGREGLCPATMLGSKDSIFAKTWLAGFKDKFEGGPPGSPTWCTHSVHLPAYLATTMKEHTTIVNHKAFFWPLYHPTGIKDIFETPNYTVPNAYSIHLWESSGKHYLNEMTEDKIKEGNNLFSNITRDLI